MNNSNWKDAAELVGITAIVASLIFVGMQLRQDRLIANSDSLVAEQILDLEIAALIDQRRDVWRKGLAGEDLSDDEKVSFDLMAYALFRQQANDYRKRFELGPSPSVDLIASTYAFFVYQNPGLRAWFDGLRDVRDHRNRAFELPEFRFFPSIIDDALKRLDEADPDLPDKYYVPY
jgi:hypothetical protein